MNGISTPFFGVSWQPATSDVEAVRGLIHFIEGRRMLYERHACADWPHRAGIARMERSAGEIRVFLSDMLVSGGISEELVDSVKSLRRATLDCLDGLERWLDFHEVWVGRDFDDARSAAQGDAADDLRGTVELFRLTVDKIMHQVAAAHGLEFESLK